MKVVIIGGGIAGLTLGIYLQKYDIQVSINERAAGTVGGGHAFLMHTDGLGILKELVEGTEIPLPGKLVREFSLKRPTGEQVQHLALGAWQCIKRTELTAFLHTLFTGEINDCREFSHFLYENNKAIAAVFANGAIEYGDVFVGADGGFSKVRTQIFGPVEFQPGRVKEVVGIADLEEVAHDYLGTFTKFQQNTSGLSFGMIPTSGVELVWFIQYDPSISEVLNDSPENLRTFCEKLMKDFPPVVQKVLQGNDFSKTYLWNTKDFDLLPRFHQGNVVVIGDAAHLALPFTSAGTTNAMVDARVLAGLLAALPQNKMAALAPDLEMAFQSFYEQRSAAVSKHLDFGRQLRDVFLNPMAHEGEEVVIPLIASEGD